jgi:ubiquinone/menaquinone biosynthesis C-methylase UbiE
MHQAIRANRTAQVTAWVVGSLFGLGFFISSIGAWTGPALGLWFVGTQKKLRGFAWMLAFAFIPSLHAYWRGIPFTGADRALKYLGVLFLAAIIGVLPFTLHRLVSPRLPGFLATLPFPLAAAVCASLIAPLVHVGARIHLTFSQWIALWMVAIIVWMWNHESSATTRVAGAAVVGVTGLDWLRRFNETPALGSDLQAPAVVWTCAAGLMTLSVIALFLSGHERTWLDRSETLARLRSPVTANPLHAEGKPGREMLVSSSGERFPVRNEIPSFIDPTDLTGDNGKYNHLYETIGGFYNDTQRVVGAFRGLDLDSYFMDYMRLLDVKPGDSVLETSVGTGLNFKYLPRGVKLTGLDLSAEMLTNCQANLRRWGLDADLYLGNAETLPFADDSFDVVFTAGAINFFNDRAKAIREMIRVAKPGSLLMIEDETEEYVQSTYEKIPYTSSFYKDREKPVTVPVDLVPAEMEDVHVDMLKDGKFYAITFRKPARASVAQTHRMSA